MFRKIEEFEYAFTKSYGEKGLNIAKVLAKKPMFKDFSCLGFYITDLDLAYEKGQVMLSTFYKNAEPKIVPLCDEMRWKLSNSTQTRYTVSKLKHESIKAVGANTDPKSAKKSKPTDEIERDL